MATAIIGVQEGLMSGTLSLQVPVRCANNDLEKGWREDGRAAATMEPGMGYTGLRTPRLVDVVNNYQMPGGNESEQHRAFSRIKSPPTNQNHIGLDGSTLAKRGGG